VPTSKRPHVDDVQYPRVSNMILKGASHEEVVNDERIEYRDTQISCIAARVWQSRSRHADIKKVSN
jgi:hypothetical protein